MCYFDHKWSKVLCLEMLDRALSAVFEGLMNRRPACQDKVPHLDEHAGADQIPIRMSLVSVAWSEPNGQVLFFLSLSLHVQQSNITYHIYLKSWHMDSLYASSSTWRYFTVKLSEILNLFLWLHIILNRKFWMSCT